MQDNEKSFEGASEFGEPKHAAESFDKVPGQERDTEPAGDAGKDGTDLQAAAEKSGEPYQA